MRVTLVAPLQSLSGVITYLSGMPARHIFVSLILAPPRECSITVADLHTAVR